MQTLSYLDPIIHRLYGADPREIPIYSISEVSGYIKVADSTLRSWVHGRTAFVGERLRRIEPIIKLPTRNQERLSFLNLVEAYTVSSLTRIEGLPFARVRSAIETMERSFDVPHPLINFDFWTDTVDLFTKDEANLVNLSRGGQLEIREIVQVFLRRVERRQPDMTPIKVFPFSRQLKLGRNSGLSLDQTRKMLVSAPKYIEVDPLIAFGSPTLAGTGVPVEIIASRNRAGESVRFIAKDYGIEEKGVREAIKYVRLRKVA